MGPLLFFLLPVFLFPSSGRTQVATVEEQVWTLAQSKKLTQDRQWLRLLHFRTTWLGTESDVDSANFFSSPQGKTDPSAELREFIRAIFLPEAVSATQDKSALCRFPARYEWLKRNLPEISAWPSHPCPLLTRFRDEVRGPSVSMVFSSYYLNNPSSAFGHTFLRVNKEASPKDGVRYELLDYGFNYAANVDTDNALVYGVKGLFGGFHGQFTSVPYYYKVREYNNAESRDLWQYQLSLTPAQVAVLVDHLWELGPAQIDYWYLTENCSFHMLSVLEAADPDLNLLSGLKKYVIPADTIQVLMKAPGLVSEVTYRPSIRTQLLHRFDRLNAKEKDVAHRVVENRDLALLAEIPDVERQSLILDGVLDLVDFRYPYEVQIATDPVTLFKNKVLSARGANPHISEPLKIETPGNDRPHDGHGSRRLGIGWRKNHLGGEGLLLEHRFALHDLYEGQTGYPDGAQISMFEMDFIYSPVEKSFLLDQLVLFEVISRSPWTRLTPAWSWQTYGGIERSPWLPGRSPEALAKLEGGGGLNADLIRSRLNLFGGVRASVRSRLEGRSDLFSLSGGPALGLRGKILPPMILGVEAWWRHENREGFNGFIRDVEATLHWQHSKNLATRLVGREETGLRSLEIQLFGYY
ncbi:MAG: DUF4105 domain-containing protein [Bdellovibrionaceae bacterium]|nr:DUF4105 domain-containing protein [Pseudobdellovibrionaceae bacterium]